MNSVFLLREMPDWERLKPVPQNEDYRRWFYGRWGRENAVISGTGRNVEYLPFRQRLSIKLARGGLKLLACRCGRAPQASRRLLKRCVAAGSSPA